MIGSHSYMRSFLCLWVALPLARGPASLGADPPARYAVGPNVQVSTAVPDVGHYECVVATDPNDARRLLAGSMYFPKGVDGVRVVGYVSADGGKTWQLSLERKGEPGEKGSGGDPAVAFGPDGSVYFTSMYRRIPKGEADVKGKLGDKDVGSLVFARSGDGGKTWGPDTTIDRYIDRPWIGLDCTDGKHRGHLYCSGSIGEAAVYTSEDSAKTFRAPVEWAPRKPHRCVGIGNPVVLSDGSAVVLYNGYVDAFKKKGVPYLAVRRTTDGGRSFGDEQLIGDWKAGGSIFLAPLPMLAADPGSKRFADRLYVVWADESAGGLTVMLSWSGDKGSTWSRPVGLSEQPGGEGAYDAMVPAVAVNRAGVVAVSWYDRRGLAAKAKGWNVRLRASLDGGETWLPSLQVNDKPSNKGQAAEALGHTAGLAAGKDGTFHPVWIDGREAVHQVWTAAVKIQPTDK